MIDIEEIIGSKQSIRVQEIIKFVADEALIINEKKLIDAMERVVESTAREVGDLMGKTMAARCAELEARIEKLEGIK